MNIYLDSNRDSSYNYPRQDWTEIRTSADFKSHIDKLVEERMNWMKVVSFDYNIDGDKTGVECLKYLVNKCVESGAPFPKVYIHAEHTGCYVEFENACDLYTKRTDKQYVLESRRKFR